MKLKKEYIILTVAIAALALYLGLRKSDRTHYELPKQEKFAAKKITRVELQSNAETLSLTKKDTTWHIGEQSYPADGKKVEEILKALESLKITALVSESGNYNRYDLGDDKKITAKVWEGEQVKREVEIGKVADTYQHTFIKLPEEKAVYHAQGNIRNKIALTTGQLRDKRVLTFEKDKIDEVTIQRGAKSLVIAKQVTPSPETKKDDKAAAPQPPPAAKNAWQTTDGADVKTDAVEKLLSSLSNVNCSEYIADAKKEDLKDPVQKITLKGPDLQFTLSLFKNDKAQAQKVPGTSSMNDYPFYLPSYQVEDIRTPINELLPEPEAGSAEKSKGKKKAPSGT